MKLPAILLFLAVLQSPLAFEVASVKQMDTTVENGIRGWSCTGIGERGIGHPAILAAPGRCRYVGQPLKSIIAEAYGMRGDRITKGPGWMDTLPYTIEAKAEEGPTWTRAQLLEMTQTLLADRFKLKFHREKKEVTGYDLVIAKDGLRIKEFVPGQQPAAPSSRPPSGQQRMSGGMTMAQLAGNLAGSIGGPIDDKTGLGDQRYMVTLTWTFEGNDRIPASSLPEPSGPQLVTAVQEQLGLKLEPKKTTIEIIVIDSVEKPLDN